MSATNLGYCPKCRQNVALVKKELDICLLIILFSFTAGIGGIIYLIIWALQPADHCVICGSQTARLTMAPPSNNISQQSSGSDTQSNYINSNTIRTQTYSAPAQGNMNQTTQLPTGQIAPQYQQNPVAERKYCPYCGNELQTKARFCGVCGSTIQ
jgi:predicted nucleic acid-binding Zn ribbon protein